MADRMYVLSNQAKVMQSPSMEARTIGVLQHGTEVNVKETKHIWFKIKNTNETPAGSANLSFINQSIKPIRYFES